jgi:spermidine synthase
VILAWGLQAIVTQSLLVREALVLMFGSEFAWGVVLFAWLLGVAIGGAIGGWASERTRRPDLALAVVLMLLSAAACAELWIFRGARAWLGVGVGELMPLSKTAVAAVLFITPASALIGIAFPLACRATGERPALALRAGTAEALPTPTSLAGGRRYDELPHGAGPLADVYALESVGSLIGGAAFSFWAVEHLAPIETALVCAALTAAASAALMATNRRRASAVGLALAAAVAAGLGTLKGHDLDAGLIQRRWQTIAPGYELCAEAESRYQNLAVGRRAEQFTLYCDGHVAADFPDPYTFVPLAHFWMCQHPDPQRVLILGGGAEGLLAEVLRHPVERIDYVEPDPKQIELIAPFLTDADRAALRDPRVTVHHVDARYFIKTQRGAFDLVIARLPEPTSALRSRFYTDEFLGELRRAMAGRAVLCMTAAAAPTDLPAECAGYLASVRAVLHRHFPRILVGWGDPAQILAATGDGLVSLDPAELMSRYERRGVASPLFDPLWFAGATDWLDQEKVAARAEQLDDAGPVEISTDLRPIIYVQRLALWERMTGGPSQRMIERLRGISLGQLVLLLSILGGLTLLVCRWRYGRRRTPSPRHERTTPNHGIGAADQPETQTKNSSPLPNQPEAQARVITDDAPTILANPWAPGIVLLSVAATGFATMALSIIWLFAFQNLYGYVYQRIGWIIALFMAGLVLGCWLVSTRSRRAAQLDGDVARSGDALAAYLWRRMIAVDVLLALLAFAVPIVLPALGRMQDTRAAFALVEWAISGLVALTGVLGGAAFGLAGGLQMGIRRRAGAAAGSIVAADHAGACAGALLTGLLLVPVFGTATAALLLGAMKLTSAMLLVLGGQPWRLKAG